jgi:hypothetical protein
MGQCVKMNGCQAVVYGPVRSRPNGLRSHVVKRGDRAEIWAYFMAASYISATWSQLTR